MTTWKRKSQEQSGSYRFDGNIYMTATVQHELSREEIDWIVQDVKRLVKEKNGIDYLQIYVDEQGRKLYFIDQLNDEMKPHHPCEHNYATLLFTWEY